MTKTNLRKFGFRDKLGYALGDCGNDFTLMMLQSYLLVFYTKVLGVSGAVIGTMFMITKFVDAFTDVSMGRIVDTHTDRNGDRFRPWLRRMAVPVVLASCLIYNYFITGWPMWAKITYVSIVYLVYGSVCYTAINIPYGAMANAITDDPGERTSLSTFRSMGAIFAGVLVGIVVPLVVYTKDEAGNNVANGPKFLLMAVIFGLIALLCYYLCYRWCLERVRIPNREQSAQKESLWTSLVEICRDRAILAIVLISICVFAATGATQTLNQYVFLDYFKNTSLLSLASMITMVAMFLMAPFTKLLSTRFGKKESSVAGLFVCAVMYLILFVIHTQSPVVYLVLLFIANMGMGYFSMVSWAMISDCIDNHYLITNERADGTVYAMYSFIKKLAGAVTGSIGAWSLALIGYDNLATVQTDGVSNAIFNISVLIPGVFMLASFLLVTFLYPLSKKRVDENVQKMREKSKQ